MAGNSKKKKSELRYYGYPYKAGIHVGKLFIKDPKNMSQEEIEKLCTAHPGLRGKVFLGGEEE